MQKIWHSIGWKILSCGCFAGINILVRYLSGASPLNISGLPTYTIMFYQHLIGFVIILLWVHYKRGIKTTNFYKEDIALHILRICTATMGIGLFYLSLRFIPVTEAVALSVTTPIFTTIGAVLFLKEEFDLPRKVAVISSIIGGILVARPDKILGLQGYSWSMLLPILAALAFALDKLFTRKILTRTQQPINLTLYLLFAITILSVIPSFKYGWVSPTIYHLPWLLLLGILGCIAQYTFNRAYTLADVTTLLPFGAARIILGALFSFIIFSEYPRALDLWFGISTIIFSTIILGIDKDNYSKIGLNWLNKQGVRS